MTAKDELKNRSYWALRTDRDNADLMLDELRQGRLRIGWGYAACQDLRLLVKKRQKGEGFTDDERDAWRNWPMLGGADGIKKGDIVLLPNLPHSGEFLLVEAAGPYQFDPLKLDKKTDVNGLGQDYGHILPVRKTETLSPIPMQDERLHAGLRASLTCRSRLWHISDYGQNIEELLAEHWPAKEWDLDRSFREVIDHALASVHERLEGEIAALLTKKFTRAELEVPCTAVLRHLFPGAVVERHGGPAEHGADVVVTWEDPLATSGSPSSLSWRAVFQVKDWRDEATEVAAVDQLAEAIKHYDRDFPVRGAYLLTLCDGESAEFRAHREAVGRKMKLPIQFVGQKRLLGLIRQYALSHMRG